MTEFAQFTAAGLVAGSVFVLLAFGWVVVMRVSGLLFFLQGEFVVLAALTMIVATEAGVALPLAMIAAVGVCVLVVLALDLAIIRPLRTTHLNEVLVILGLAIIMADLMRRVFGPRERILESYLPWEPVTILGTRLFPDQLLLMAVAGLLVVGMFLLLFRTSAGLTMRAAAENRGGAQLVGISPNSVRSMGFVIAAVLGAVAGIVLAPVSPIGPTSGLLMGVKGFIAAVLGRWTFPGTVVGGLVIGLAESYTVGYLSSAYKDVTAFAIVIVVLLADQTRRQRLGLARVG